MSKKDRRNDNSRDLDEIQVPTKDDFKGHRNNNKRKRDKDRKDDRWEDRNWN